MVYLDASALVKLVRPEPESAALGDFLAGRPRRASSKIAAAEVPLAVRRRTSDPSAFERARSVLSDVGLLDLTDARVRLAAETDPPLKALDAIHLATALSLIELEAFVVYDRRLIAAAEAAGLPVASPGTS
ncbi:MAG: type II toxin-antitoxin system VapC family toxin [Thermoleophilaceae bacterium]|nr:type II toxin-antitoxin system VapC family toxin [Thermoleophilaceae bacterium]